ncbi:hypothetical protein DFH11DRAFT_1746552 [Phellopilus nigrolimitatus]|nr:hypothetical protein DFH11DRAFT_1746552 [Phellopilus nigrolimitatus]
MTDDELAYQKAILDLEEQLRKTFLPDQEHYKSGSNNVRVRLADYLAQFLAFLSQDDFNFLDKPKDMTNEELARKLIMLTKDDIKGDGRVISLSELGEKMIRKQEWRWVEPRIASSAAERSPVLDEPWAPEMSIEEKDEEDILPPTEQYPFFQVAQSPQCSPSRHLALLAVTTGLSLCALVEEFKATYLLDELSAESGTRGAKRRNPQTDAACEVPDTKKPCGVSNDTASRSMRIFRAKRLLRSAKWTADAPTGASVSDVAGAYGPVREQDGRHRAHEQQLSRYRCTRDNPGASLCVPSSIYWPHLGAQATLNGTGLAATFVTPPTGMLATAAEDPHADCGKRGGLNSPTNLTRHTPGPFLQNNGWHARVGAMAGCALTAVLGIMSVSWYTLGERLSDAEV